MSTTVVITQAGDGKPLIRLDRPRHTARLHLEDVDELVVVRDAISQHLGDQHAPAVSAPEPTPEPPAPAPPAPAPQQRTRLHELRRVWRWLTAPVFNETTT